MVDTDAPATPRLGDDAVSPVIGVILMVAITVVLAAVVFLLVSDTSTDGATLPRLSFDVTESQDEAKVQAASRDAYWDQLQIRLSVDGGWGLNADPATGTIGGTWTTVGGGAIEAGDVLTICADTPGPVRVDIRYVDLNTLISYFELNAVAACP